MDAVVVVGVGEFRGSSFTDEQHDRAVGSDVVEAAVVGSSGSPSVAVFEAVVLAASRVGVCPGRCDHRRRATRCGRFGSGRRGSRIRGDGTLPLQQGGGEAGVAGEQAFALAEIDHGRTGIEHHATDLGCEQRLDQQWGGDTA